MEKLSKDKSINITAMCDARCFLSETIEDDIDSIYVKLIEITNVLITKGAEESSFILNVSNEMYNLVNSQNKFKVYKNNNIPDDQIEIESNIGKSVLIIENIFEKTNE